ncbi:SRPBCC family protein [Nocardia carnea]|uniref:SRPBCC family protein n=1 Tax=Nocardia carnea TaxID=37328 RepID=A0ABW7TNT4_9NOCA|nr:SRPBCC family protein [Nocardia carnea]
MGVLREKAGTACAIALGGLAVGYRVWLRPRLLTWGATPEEISRNMPGDELQPEPDLTATRAVTIHAPPDAVWPWLVQIGPGRGGAYTYDWIENLAGLDMHSADEIRPEWQNLAVGDTLSLGSSGPSMGVQILSRPHALVFADDDRTWVWALCLYPTGDGSRLVSRNRIVVSRRAALQRLWFACVVEPGSWVMERKMLLGIKERVHHAQPDRLPDSREAARAATRR